MTFPLLGILTSQTELHVFFHISLLVQKNFTVIFILIIYESQTTCSDSRVNFWVKSEKTMGNKNTKNLLDEVLQVNERLQAESLQRNEG